MTDPFLTSSVAIQVQARRDHAAAQARLLDARIAAGSRAPADLERIGRLHAVVAESMAQLRVIAGLPPQ